MFWKCSNRSDSVLQNPSTFLERNRFKNASSTTRFSRRDLDDHCLCFPLDVRFDADGSPVERLSNLCFGAKAWIQQTDRRSFHNRSYDLGKNVHRTGRRGFVLDYCRRDFNSADCGRIDVDFDVCG